MRVCVQLVLGACVGYMDVDQDLIEVGWWLVLVATNFRMVVGAIDLWLVPSYVVYYQ